MDPHQKCFASETSSTAYELSELGTHILLCLSFFICKMRIIIIHILDSLWGLKVIVKCFAQCMAFYMCQLLSAIYYVYQEKASQGARVSLTSGTC